MLAPWRKSYDQLDNILKSRNITLPTVVPLVKAMVFPLVMYGCESWTIKKAEHQRLVAFELLEKTLESPLDCKEIITSQSFFFSFFFYFTLFYFKEISSEYSLEGTMLKLKFQYLAKELTH